MLWYAAAMAARKQQEGVAQLLQLLNRNDPRLVSCMHALTSYQTQVRL